MTHNNGLRSWHLMTNLLIDRILSMERICIAYGAVIGMLGQTQKMFASEIRKKTFQSKFFKLNSRKFSDPGTTKLSNIYGTLSQEVRLRLVSFHKWLGRIPRSLVLVWVAQRTEKLSSLQVSLKLSLGKTLNF